MEPARLLRLAHLSRIAWLRFRRPLTLGARAIVPNGQGQVLLIRHSYVDGWHLPGGGVGRGETLQEGIRREIHEEVGLETMQDARLQGIYARFKHGASDHVATFVVENWQGEIRVNGWEILEAAFFPQDSLPAETSPGTRRRLAEYRGEAPVAEHW